MVILPQVVFSVRFHVLPAASAFGGAAFQDLGVAGGLTVGAGHGFAAAAAPDADGDAPLADAAGADGDGVAPAALVEPGPVPRSTAAPMARPMTTMTVTPMAMALRWV